MDTGIQIGKYIKRWLQSDDELVSMVKKSNMVPLLVHPTEKPFISWERMSCTPNYTKDGQIVDVVEVGIAIISDDYEQSINIAERVRNLLEWKSYRDANIHIPAMEIQQIQEDNVDDAYVKEILFEFHIETLNKN